MYNIAAHFRLDYDALMKWDLMVYAGCGMVNNMTTGQKPFALSYGIVGRYRLDDRLFLSAELGNTTSWQDLDGQGTAGKLGDHLLQAIACA